MYLWLKIIYICIEKGKDKKWTFILYICIPIFQAPKTFEDWGKQEIVPRITDVSICNYRECFFLLLLKDTTSKGNFNWMFVYLLLGCCCPHIFAHISETIFLGVNSGFRAYRELQEHILYHSEKACVSQHVAELMSSCLLTGSKSSGML